jgi:polyhydroxyalkanoate synthase
MSVHTILSVMLQASDSLRRSTGLVFDHLNRGPVETEWIAVLSEPGFTLRYYGDVNASAPPVLVLPAPIKRSYIFDLLPSVSVVQRLLDGGFSVYLMEWREADPGASWGLAQYAVEWIARATQAIAEEHGIRPLLVGHSLGGTFAAISAACTPQLVGKLLLIEAPLAPWMPRHGRSISE